MTGAAVGALVIASLISAAASPVVVAGLKRAKLVDRPNERSSHQIATPRGGGLAVVLGLVIGVAAGALIIGATSVLLLPLVFIALAAAIGFSDDLRPLPAIFRLGGQLAIAVAFVALADLSGLRGPGWLAIGLAGLFVVGFINAFNFMDGINGISALSTVIIGGALGIGGLLWTDSPVAILPLAAAGAALGFAPFNFPVAKVFLGDVGSYALGSTLAISALLLVNAGAPEIGVLLPFSVYLGDAGWTLLSRAVRGERILESHREHAYQRLANGQWSHTITTIFVTGLTLVCAVLGLLVADRDLIHHAIAGATALLLTGTYLTMPWLVDRSRGSAVIDLRQQIDSQTSADDRSRVETL